jgi:hypothetical protein
LIVVKKASFALYAQISTSKPDFHFLNHLTEEGAKVKPPDLSREASLLLKELVLVELHERNIKFWIDDSTTHLADFSA